MTVQASPIKGLENKHIAVPESRQLDVFANMLESRGATVFRCPLVSIYDSPDTASVNAWLERFVQQPPDGFVILTGEGLRRLLGFAERHGIREPFIQALQNVPTLTRGPKPGAALRDIGLKPTMLAAEPTTPGVIQTLQTFDLQNKRFAVQLYGDHENLPLQDALNAAGATVDAVMPYRYADDIDDQRVASLIEQLISQKFDAICFTSMSQVTRLMKLAVRIDDSKQTRRQLVAALNQTCVASVGPVVRDALAKYAVHTTLMPEQQFFMKPLARRLVDHFQS